jgi:nucleoside-diphosphate-sugar epimerase
VRYVTENTPLAHPGRLRIGYVETKYVAEELLRNAGRDGLPVTIYRPLDFVARRRLRGGHQAHLAQRGRGLARLGRRDLSSRQRPARCPR